MFFKQRDKTQHGNLSIRKAFGACAAALLLALPSQVLALDAASLFAPAFTGDGQTANWRIINTNEARKNPWTAVGNILIPGGSAYCSAVLVAPRIVLTANHCLYALDYTRPDGQGRPAKQLMNPQQFAFFGGVHDNSFVDMIGVEQVVTGGWVPGSNETAKDWAIVILKRPANAVIVPFTFRPYDAEVVAAAWRNKLVVAAYPEATFAYSAVLRFSFNCSILKSNSANLVSHDCASEAGSSGAPIFVEEDGELRLIGIHSSVQSNNAGHKVGVSINSFLPQLRVALARFSAPTLAEPAIERPVLAVVASAAFGATEAISVR